MHELSIAMDMIEMAEETAKREGMSLVAGIVVRVGTLSGVDPDALEMVFPMAAENTLCAGAVLTIKKVAATVFCRQCARETAAEYPFGVCSECGSSDTDVRSGREMIIQSLELRE